MALSITSATIDSTGQSCALVIAGATGALSFPGGVGSGLYVRNTLSGIIYEVSVGVYSISGTTVTIPLNGIISSGSVVNVLPFSFNLTDTIAATVANTTIGATNNSTRTANNIALTPSSLGINGFFVDVAGPPSLRLISNNGLSSDATIDFVLNCTDVTFIYKTSLTVSAPFSVSIDGGAYSNVGLSIQGLVTIATLGTGLSAANHTFSIKFLGGTTNVGISLFCQSYGGTGVMSQPLSGTASAPGFWSTTYPASAFSQYEFLQNANSIKSNYTFECGTTASAVVGNAWNLNTASIFPVGTGNGMSFSFQIAGTQSVLKLFCGQNNACYDVRVDGVSVGHVTVTANSPTTYGYVDFSSFVSGLSGTNHNIVITLVGFSGQPYIGSMIAIGAAITTSPPAARTHSIMYGDSITACPFTTSVAANGVVGYLQGWPYMVANSKNWAYTNRGVSGSATHYFNGSGETLNADAGENRTNVVTGCSHVPLVVIENYGDNDIRQVGANSASRPHTTTTQVITASGSPQVVTVSSSSGFANGQVVQVDIGAADTTIGGLNYESVTLTAAAAGTVTGIFTKNHSSGITISRPELLIDFQTSWFNMTQAILAGTPGTTLYYALGIFPTNDPGSAAAFGLTASGASANVGSANFALWNNAKSKALTTSGTGNGKGDNSTYLTAPQAARCQYRDVVPWGLNGTTNPNYDVSGGAPVDYTSNYVAGGLHPNDAGNGLANATNLGNGIIAMNVLSMLSASIHFSPSLFSLTPLYGGSI